MGVNFGNISDEDLNRAENIRNPPAFDVGDAPSGGDANFDALFDNSDLDSLFGGSDSGGGSDPFSGSSNNSGSSESLGSIFDSPSQMNGQMNGMGNGFTGVYPAQNQINQTPKKDTFDKAMDFGAEGITNLSSIVLELVKSIGNRTADDLGYYGTRLAMTGGIGFAICLILSIISALAKVKFLGINGISGVLMISFGLTLGLGPICLGIAAILITGTNRDCVSSVRDLPDVNATDNATNEYEDELGDIMSDLFGDDSSNESISLDDVEDSIENVVDDNKDDEPELEFMPAPQHIDFNRELDNVSENSVMGRKILIETFLRFLPTNNPEFAKRVNLDSDGNQFKQIEANCLKALSNVLKCEMEEVKSYATSIVETFFSFEVKMQRVKGFTKLNDFANEIEVYVRNKPTDTSVTASVEIRGDYFYIVITKGISAVITLRDAFMQKEVLDFFNDEHNTLPIITGITELGEVMYSDAKLYDTMMIAGKPRSGKSWYVLGILMSLMLFNTPEDIQFIIIDPKESNLFSTLSLMPHVAGLHNADNILDIMDDIINIEAQRRKRILLENKCDDIWALREKGIKLPVLYLVIDEYMTIKNKLAETGQDKELDSRLQTLISQLPSQGIRLIFVPHRATGVVNKTNRTMLQFTASVRGDTDDVEDTLGIKSWKRPLVNPGDIALKTSSSQNPLFVRGVAVTTSDEKNAEFVETAAKVFYKLGVDLVEWGSPRSNEYMTIAVNRDEDKVRDKLGNSRRIQYNANNIFDDI